MHEISTKIKKKNTKLEATLVLSNSATNGIISQNDYFDKDIANDENIDKYYVISKGDFVYNPRKSSNAPYGPINILEKYDKGIASPLYTCFSIKTDKQEFLKYYFKSNKWHRFIYINGDKGARGDRVSIKDDVFYKMPIMIPTYLESEKLSNLLSLLERKITIARSKYETLKKYKKGLIQKLIGKIVFTDYYRLSDVCKIDTGKLDANQMVVDGKYKFFTCSRDDFYINSYAFNCEAILVSGNGDVGFSKYYKGKFNAYQRTYVLHDFLVNAKYVKIIFDNNVNKIVRKETNIGAMPYIRKSTFDKVLIPKLKKESIEYIVNIYDSLSYKIDTLEAKLSLLKSFWHQLLKDMFI